MSNGHEQERDPQPVASRSRRDAALAGLIPPFVHKLNNALGGVSGLAELLARPGGADRAGDFAPTMVAQSAEALTLLAALAELSRPVGSESEATDLVEVARRVLLLVQPLAEARGAELECRAPDRALVVQTDGRGLFQELVTCICEALLPLARSQGRPWRVRLRLEVGEAEPRLVLCAPLACAAWTSESLELPGLRRSLRSRAGAFTSRLAFAFESAAPLPTSAPDRAPSAPVVLLESDRQLAELVQAVLTEAGHRVRLADSLASVDSALEAERVQLCLLESAADGLGSGSDPAATAALADRARARGSAVALLGTPSPPGLPNLPKPFRPGELLEFVAARLAHGG